MKACFKCGEEKAADDFYVHPGMADGRLNKCKECTKKDVACHRSANIAQLREYDRRRANLPHRLSMRVAIGSRWRAQYPERRAAQTALGNAVRCGRVIPWPVCAIPECSEKPEAHHPDYGRPLDVVWLCSAHHKQAHAQSKRCG
jgi:hypothetical protein